MLLRTRILLGYGYLIALLLLSVSVAALNSSRVAGNARQIRERNIDSLTLAVQMIEQLERQDSETLLGLLHPAQGTRLEDAEKAFQAALAEAMRLDELGGGADAATLSAIAEQFTRYRRVRSELLTQQHEDSLAAAEDYGGATNTAVIELKQQVFAYLEGKKNALKTANEEASRTAVEGAVLLGVMVTLALLSLGFLSRSLQRDVLGRLLEVGHVTEAIAAGDRRRRVRDFYHDELGLVARQLNAALDRQHELEAQMQGRLLEQRRVLVGLLNQWPTPAGMIGIDGEIVASTLTHDDELELDRLTPRIRAAAKVLMTRRFVKAEELAVDIKASDGKRVVRVRALASGDNQIAGWLATFDAGAAEPARPTNDVHARVDASRPAEPATEAARAEPSGLEASRPAESLAAADIVEAARRESSGARPVAQGSALLGPPSFEPSGVTSRPAGSASLGPMAREPSGLSPRPSGPESWATGEGRFIAPPREPSGMRPVVMPGGAHEDPEAILAVDAGVSGSRFRAADEAAASGTRPRLVDDADEGAPASEDTSADMKALRALAFPPPPPVTRTPDKSGGGS